jgi:hypothetical protein
MRRPKSADKFQWDEFVKYAEEQGISLKNKGDYSPWWDCWKNGYRIGYRDACNEEE